MLAGSNKVLALGIKSLPKGAGGLCPDSSCCWLKYLPQAVQAASACFWHCGHKMLTPCALGMSCWKYLPLVRRTQGTMKCLPLATQAPGTAKMKCLPLAYWAQGTIKCLPLALQASGTANMKCLPPAYWAQGTIKCLPWYCRHQALLMPPARHIFSRNEAQVACSNSACCWVETALVCLLIRL